MKRTFLSVLILAATLGTAQAQSAFDGGYYGFTLGAGTGSITGFDGTGDLAVTGALAGALVGWNFSNGNIVYGVEADISGGRVSGSATCINPTWGCNADIQALVTLRGRVGVETGNALVYVTAGGAGGLVELETVNSSSVAYPGSTFSTGWTAGVGVEGAMGSGPWRYRVEALYTDLGNADYETDASYTAGTTLTMVRFGMTRPF